MNNLTKIRILLIIFIMALVVSGLTAIPLTYELKLIAGLLNIDPNLPASHYDGFRNWIAWVYEGVRETDLKYPFIAYGTDWLAFGHLMIAIVFFGPLKDPIKNIWVINFGMIACLAIIPYALLFGAIRGIPFYWILIDCSFGIIGIIPLLICKKLIKKMDS